MDDLISVIVPVYNVEKYLSQCIESIINQTYKNLQIILVNDGSTDESLKICNEYKEIDKRIVVIDSVNKGVSNARNLGIEASYGKYITFIDSDDFFDLEFCENMLKNIKNTDADCVICGYKRIYPNKSEIIVNSPFQTINEMEFLEKILEVQSGLGFCHMKLWRSEIIKNKNIRFKQELLVGEDALFCMQCSEYIKKICLLDKPLYNYRFNDQSLVRKFDKKYANKYLKSMKETEKYLLDKYKNNLKISEKINNYITYHVLLIIVNYCFNPENKLSFLKQIDLLKQICNIEEFKKAIEKCNYKGFSLSRKITVFTIKKKVYLMTAIIARIRQFQFKR